MSTGRARITEADRAHDAKIADCALEVTMDRFVGETVALATMRGRVRGRSRLEAAVRARWWWWRIVYALTGSARRTASATGHSRGGVADALVAFYGRFPSKREEAQLEQDIDAVGARMGGGS